MKRHGAPQSTSGRARQPMAVAVVFARAALLLGALASACAPEPGRFEMSFVWEDGPPAEPHQICARLEPEAGGSITLAPADYEPGQADIRLAVPAVQHGVAYVAVVDVARQCGERVEYHGRSSAFMIETGARLHYGPRVVLERTPHASGEGLTIAAARSVDEGDLARVATPLVDLQLWPEKSARVTVALDQRFTVGVEERALTELSGRDNPRTWPAWNLCGSDVAAPDCEDGLKHVFVKFTNDVGLPSEPLQASVILDTRPPTLEQLSVEPSVARAGSRVAIRLTADEPLAGCPQLRVEAPLAFAPCESGSGEPQRCEWCAEVGASVPDGSYEFSGELSDRVGHVSVPFAGEIRIDQTEPGLSEPATLSGEVERANAQGWPVLRAGETLEVAFEVAEPLAQPARVDVEGQAVDCDAPVVDAARGTERYRCRFEARTGMGDGPRSVSAILQDRAGHTRRLALGTVLLDVELPRAVDTTLIREPHYPPAVGSGSVALSPLDPFTAQPVKARLTLFASKLPELEPALSVWRRDGACEAPDESAPALEFHRCNAFSDGACPGDARVLEYVHALAPDAASGEYCLAIGWRNAHGDTLLEALPVRLFVETEAPDNAIDFAETVHVRVPWGAEHTGGAPSFSVLGRILPGAVSSFPAAVAEVVVSAQPSIDGLLGRGVPTGEGEFALTSSGGDRLDVYAATVTQSGNLSPFAPIVHGEWVATLGGKLPGSVVDNPHRAFEWGNAPAVLAPEHEGVEISGAEWGGSGDESVSTYARLRWREHPSEAVRPPPRSQHALAYDAARGKTVLFGGIGIDGSEFSDTWEWDGQRWRRIEPALGVEPPARFGHALAYHAASGRVLLFGGQNQQNLLGDTWTWDGQRWQQVGSDVPPARADHALAYDAARGRVVLFDGFPQRLVPDTWEWDGVSWHERTPEGGGPPHRFGHGLAYDPERERVVLVGGISPEGFRADRWLWNGNEWEPDAPLAPPLVSAHALVFDAGQAELLLLGGTICGLPTFFDPFDTACFIPPSLGPDFLRTGTGEPITVSGGSPPARRNHALAYDSARNRVVLFGGSSFAAFAGALGDTWEWDGASRTWQEVAPAIVQSPSARHSHAMAYLEDADRVVSFGGRLPGGAESAETWLWDGVRWQALSAAAPAPPARAQHGLSHDPTRGELILFGGLNSGDPLADLWSFAASAPGSEVWSLLEAGSTTPCPDPVAPCARNGHALAHDGALLLLSSGGPGGAVVSLGDLWGWDGQWHDLGVTAASDCDGETAPCARSEHAFVCADTGSEAADCTLFGGVAASTQILGDTWTWDGQSFERRAEGPVPPPRARATFTFDSQRGRALLFGGSTSGSDRDDAWEWDGATWRELTPLPGDVLPPARSAHAAAFSPVRGEGVVFGGQNQSQSLADTWLWLAPDAPAHSFHVALAALAELSRLDLATSPSGSASAVTLDRLSVAARTGGNGSGTNGTGLHVWSAFGFGEPVAANAAPDVAPAPLCWAAELAPGSPLLALAGEELHFQLRPRAGTGSGDPARLATDYVEVRVAYHLGQAEPAARRAPSTSCP